MSLLPPSPPARHKIPIQAVNKKPFSRAFLGKGQARNFSLEDPLFPVYCSAHFFSLPAKYGFLCGENRPPFGQGSFALINRAVMHGHALAQRSQTNASFFVGFFFFCAVTSELFQGRQHIRPSPWGHVRCCCCCPQKWACASFPLWSPDTAPLSPVVQAVLPINYVPQTLISWG